MGEKTFKIIPKEIAYLCDICGMEMKWDRFTKTSNPPWYSHTCPDCGATKDFRTVYPKIIWERKNDD